MHFPQLHPTTQLKMAAASANISAAVLELAKLSEPSDFHKSVVCCRFLKCTCFKCSCSVAALARQTNLFPGSSSSARCEPSRRTLVAALWRRLIRLACQAAIWRQLANSSGALSAEKPSKVSSHLTSFLYSCLSSRTALADSLQDLNVSRWAAATQASLSPRLAASLL